MNKKNYSFDLETFKDMLQICPSLPRQKFVDPPFEEEILAFIRELGYSGNVMSLSDIKVDTLPQPWRTFDTIINKCLSDLVYQIENKVSKKNKDMYYPRFTKVIINHFMSQDRSIPREARHNYIALTLVKSGNEKDDEVNVSKDDDDDENNDQDDVDEQTESDNDGDDFVHPKFFTHDDEERQDEEVNEEDSFNPRVLLGLMFS
ncbi:hypothetical protein Tco_1572082 [Tanacetum coccineum]